MRPQFNLNAVHTSHGIPNANQLREFGFGTICVALSFPLWRSLPALFEVFIICALLGLCYLQRPRVFYLGLIFGLIFFTYNSTVWQNHSALLKQAPQWQILGLIEDIKITSQRTILKVSVMAPKALSEQKFQLIDSDPLKEYHHGQHWLLSVTIAPVPEHWHATKPYQRSLYGQNISATGWVNNSLLQDHTQSIRGQLFSEVQRFGVSKDSWLPALLLGIKPVESEFSSTLKNAGIIHLFVISGLHFAVVAGGFYWFLKRIDVMTYTRLSNRQSRLLICLALILAGYFYVDVVGAQGPAQRAFVAMCIGLLLRWLYVRVRFSDLLLWVFFYLVLTDPFCVVLASIYLTFGALLCIGFCAHWLPLNIDTRWEKIKGFVAFQMVFTVLFTPVQYHILGYIHPLSWLWNLLFIPIITLFFVPVGGVLLVIMYVNKLSNGMFEPIAQGGVLILDFLLEWLLNVLANHLTEPVYGSISLLGVLGSWLLIISGASLPVIWWGRCGVVVVGLGLLILGLTL